MPGNGALEIGQDTHHGAFVKVAGRPCFGIGEERRVKGLHAVEAEELEVRVILPAGAESGPDAGDEVFGVKLRVKESLEAGVVAGCLHVEALPIIRVHALVIENIGTHAKLDAKV